MDLCLGIRRGASLQEECRRHTNDVESGMRAIGAYRRLAGHPPPTLYSHNILAYSPQGPQFSCEKPPFRLRRSGVGSDLSSAM